MKVPAKGTPLRQRMIEDMGIRNLSPATQYNYINCVAKYALHFGKSPAVLGPEHIRGYQVHLTQVKRVSWSVFNTAVCALRFLYRITLQKDWAVEHIPYPKKPKRLPEVLSLDEVWRFLAVMFARGLDEGSEILVWVRAVATAILAGVIAKLAIFAPGVLAAVPTPVRVCAVLIGFLGFLAIRRSVFAGVIVGEIALVLGALLFGA